jgi:hypothetical protein
MSESAFLLGACVAVAIAFYGMTQCQRSETHDYYELQKLKIEKRVSDEK